MKWFSACDLLKWNDVDLWPVITGYSLSVDMSCEQHNQRVILCSCIVSFKGFLEAQWGESIQYFSINKQVFEKSLKSLSNRRCFMVFLNLWSSLSLQVVTPQPKGSVKIYTDYFTFLHIILKTIEEVWKVLLSSGPNRRSNCSSERFVQMSATNKTNISK